MSTLNITAASLTALAGLLVGFQGGRQYQRAHIAWGTYRSTLRSVPRLYRNAWAQAQAAAGWVLLATAAGAGAVWFAVRG